MKEFQLKSGEKGSVIETRKINLSYGHDNEYVVYAIRELAVRAGFAQVDEIMIATAASELATNILRFAGKGDIEANIIKDVKTGLTGIEMLASDNGPGIKDIGLALQEKFSSLPNSLGLGLPSVKRIMDEFYIESVLNRGTRVLARKWRDYGKD